jgi:hypothetical protein
MPKYQYIYKFKSKTPKSLKSENIFPRLHFRNILQHSSGNGSATAQHRIASSTYLLKHIDRSYIQYTSQEL